MAEALLSHAMQTIKGVKKTSQSVFAKRAFIEFCFVVVELKLRSKLKAKFTMREKKEQGGMKMYVSVFSAQDATDVIAGKLEAFPTWRKLLACDLALVSLSNNELLFIHQQHSQQSPIQRMIYSLPLAQDSFAKTDSRRPSSKSNAWHLLGSPR